MNQLKCYSIIGAVFVIIIGSISHFVYEWTGNNPVIGFFFPINESTWEHMKLIFFPMLIYSFFFWKNLRNSYPCLLSSCYFGMIVGTLAIPVIFYTYTGILGNHFFILDIATFIIAVIISFLTIYQCTLSCAVQKYNKFLKISVLMFFLMFMIFTYFTPKLHLFANPS